MIWVGIICVILLIIAAVYLFHDNDQVGIALAVIGLAIFFLATFTSFLIIDVSAVEHKFKVSYKDGKLINDDTSPYGLIVRERDSYATWTSIVKEYQLYDNFGEQLLYTTDKERLIEFFYNDEDVFEWEKL